MAANTIIAYIIPHIEKDKYGFSGIKGRYLSRFEGHPDYDKIDKAVMEEITRRDEGLSDSL